MNFKREKIFNAVEGRPFILWIGVITPLKKPLDVIEIARKIPEMDFVLIGSPMDLSLLNRLLDAMPPNLFYLGTVSDQLKKDLIKKCSAGLTTSIYEGFGWTPFEFLTNGKPILAYPLEVFKEIYGDFLIFCKNINEFIEKLRKLQLVQFQLNISKKAVLELKIKYDFDNSAFIMKKDFQLDKLTIITPDIPIDSDIIAGYLLVDWLFWKSIINAGTKTQILATGNKYCEMFGLRSVTTLTGGTVLVAKKKVNSLLKSTNPFNLLYRKISTLILMGLEPISLVKTYAFHRKKLSSEFVLVAGEPQLFASVLIKVFFRKKIVNIIHDTRFYNLIWSKQVPFFMRLYYLFYTFALRYTDHVIVVSKTSRKQLLTFYPFRNKVSVIWDGLEK